ncbi:MAG: hypothetical protein AAF433_03990 [Bacteroidota bacterium]
MIFVCTSAGPILTGGLDPDFILQALTSDETFGERFHPEGRGSTLRFDLRKYKIPY